MLDFAEVNSKNEIHSGLIFEKRGSIDSRFFVSTYQFFVVIYDSEMIVNYWLFIVYEYSD
jgi:hypothetical protein